MMTSKHSIGIVAPLTRISKRTGEPYVRPPNVLSQIRAVLDLPIDQAFDLARGGRLYPQTLVYLMRNFRPNRRDPRHDAIVLAFFARLKSVGERIVGGLPETQRDWVDGLVADKVMQWLPTDRMDAFEVSFKQTAERLYLSELRRVRVRTRDEVSREDLVEPDSGLTGEEAADALASRPASTTSLAEARAQLSELYEALTDRERLAVGYHLELGLTEKETGDLIGCSDRHVRNLIKSARAKARGEERPARRSAGRKE